MSDVVLRFRLSVLVVGVTLVMFLMVMPHFGNGQIGAALGAGGSQVQKDGLLTVAFLDVGQGDAIFIETPDGIQVLIDGGPDATVLRELPEVMPWFDRSIDMVVATHPDKDHIGGLVDVLARYAVGTIFSTENESATAVSSAFVFSAAAEDAVWVQSVRAGDVISLGASTTLRLLSPGSDPTNWESNASSIVAQLIYGDTAFMLTGDAPMSIETHLAKQHGTSLQSEVLKLGHHGSQTSTAEEFLTVVIPAYAVVSAGANNQYGHPHEEVVKRVEIAGVELLSTAISGTIVFKSDGERVWRGE